MKLCRTKCTVTGPELFLFLIGISIGLYISAYSPFILFKVCLHYVSSNSLSNVDCMSITNSTVQSKVEAEASVYLVFLQLANTIPGIFSVLLVSAWSDAHGRKLPLLCCSAGCIVSSALMIAFAVYPSLSIHYLIFPQIIFGFFDPLFLFSFCFAMITDVVNVPSQVAVRMGIATGLLFLGILIGNLSCSLIETQLQYSYGYVFLASTVVSVVSFFCAVLFLRETRFLRDEQQQQHEQQQHPIGQKTLKELIITDGIMEYVSTLVKVRSESKRKLLWISLTIFLGLYMCDNVCSCCMSNSLRLPSQTLSTVLCCLFNGPSPSFRQSVFLTCSNESAGMTHRSSSLVLLCQFLRQLFSQPAPISTWFSSVSSRSTVLFIHWTFIFTSSLCIRWFVNGLFSCFSVISLQLSGTLRDRWIYWKTRIKSVQHTATVEVDKSDLIDEENNNSDTT
ncbi:hypothetical protein D917_02974 [Trichinella nativa]|uniref:Solute carrier family 46 member 3 n=1 Tax=Trichinella nativa TaxID=6335 RepID=A0A1Y3EBP1_9BILA|nr:hypothetical protein D917_02974 [Trichinella nativa]